MTAIPAPYRLHNTFNKFVMCFLFFYHDLRSVVRVIMCVRSNQNPQTLEVRHVSVEGWPVVDDDCVSFPFS
jgi:hypothetical protein